MLQLIAIFVAGFLSACILTHLVRRHGRRFGLVDEPEEGRKIHKRVMPTSGGIGMAGGMAVALFCWFLLEPAGLSILDNSTLLVGAGALLMLIIGVVDDRTGIGPKRKFLAQVIAAYLLLHAGFRFELGHLPFIEGDVYQMALYTIPLTVIWVVAVMNAVNLIDGLDGLAAGLACIAFAMLGLIYGLNGHAGLVALAVIVVAGIAGFLVYNFNPASIFMGDSGSLVIGYLLAAFTLAAPLHGDMNVALLIPFVVLGLPILDTGISILRRMATQRSIFAPDRGHIHHILSRRRSVRQSVLILYTAGAWFGGAAVLMALATPIWAYVICINTGILALLWFHLMYARERHPVKYTRKSSLAAPILKMLIPQSNGLKYQSSVNGSSNGRGSDPGMVSAEGASSQTSKN